MTGFAPVEDNQGATVAGEELLAGHRAALPDAVVCANDQMAIGVLRTLTAAGVRVACIQPGWPVFPPPGRRYGPREAGVCGMLTRPADF